MKVIKSGDGRKGWAKECGCTGAGNGGGGCGAVLLVEEADVFRTTSSCRDETTYYASFRCPECGVVTDLGNSDTGYKDLPGYVVQGLRPEGSRKPSNEGVK